MIQISNNGPDIVSTTYWGTEHAKRGYLFLSTNAGSVRLLVPDVQAPAIREMKTAKYAILSRGQWNGRDGLELLFEDFTDSPYAIHLVTEQADMLPDGQGEWTLAVWTQKGKEFECPLKYRRVKSIPYMKGWAE